MKQLLVAFAMCQSMFCAIPSPFKCWDEKAGRKMLIFLPFVGLEIGLIWWGLGLLCRFLNLGSLLSGAVLCAWSFLATGYMHLDGFMDVTDAVKSWRSAQRRREILKDSHVGSFSVIACCLLIVSQFAVFASVDAETDLRALILIPVVSRCCSALSVALLSPMDTSQYASRERSAATVAPHIVVLAAAFVSGAIFGKVLFSLLGGVVGYLLALRRGYRSLEGMNGDIAGYALTVSEFVASAVMVLL